MRSGLCLIVLAVAGTASSSVLAERVHHTSASALFGPGSWSGGSPDGVAAYSTGFEPGEGFVPGPIGGQAGWTNFAGATEGQVSTANPAAGLQHLRIAKQVGRPAGALTGGFSPVFGGSMAPTVVSVDVAISALDGADYDVVPQAPSQGFLTARVKFSYLGDILVLDDTGAGLVFVDTGDDWVAGGYRNLRIEIDSGADSINYYYDNALIHTSATGIVAGTQVEQVVLLSDNFQLSDVGDFDNLSVNVVPAPGVVALLGLGGLVGLRRRR